VIPLTELAVTQLALSVAPRVLVAERTALLAERAQLLGERAALMGYLDRTTLALARARGRSVECIRLELGLPERTGER